MPLCRCTSASKADQVLGLSGAMVYDDSIAMPARYSIPRAEVTRGQATRSRTLPVQSFFAADASRQTTHLLPSRSAITVSEGAIPRCGTADPGPRAHRRPRPRVRHPSGGIPDLVAGGPLGPGLDAPGQQGGPHRGDGRGARRVEAELDVADRGRVGDDLVVGGDLDNPSREVDVVLGHPFEQRVRCP